MRPSPNELLPAEAQGVRLLSSAQAMRMLHISRTTLYSLMRRKVHPLPTVSLGKLRRFPLDKLRWWMENLGK